MLFQRRHNAIQHKWTLNDAFEIFHAGNQPFSFIKAFLCNMQNALNASEEKIQLQQLQKNPQYIKLVKEESEEKLKESAEMLSKTVSSEPEKPAANSSLQCCN